MTRICLDVMLPVVALLGMGVFSAVELVLNAILLYIWNIDTTSSRSSTYSVYRRRTDLTSTGLMEWAGSHGVLDTVILTILFLGLASQEKGRRFDPISIRTRRIKPLAITCAVVASIAILRPLIVLIYVFVDYNNDNVRTSSYRASFSLESALCEYQSVRGPANFCGVARASRYLLIPLFVFSFIVGLCAVRRARLTMRSHYASTSSVEK